MPAVEEVAFPRLTEAEIETVASMAKTCEFADGDIVFKAGQAEVDLFIVETGQIEIQNPSNGHKVIVTHDPGQFSGDIDVLTGRPVIVTGVARGQTRALCIKHSELRLLLNRVPSLGEKLMTAFTRRRELLSRQGNLGLHVVGPGGAARDTNTVREFLYKNFVPFTWNDSDSSDGKDLLTRFGSPKKMPVIECNGKVLVNPTLQELANEAGIWRHCPSQEADLVIVGAGPAGIAAAVYASSEGLSTLMLDRLGPGGQAGGSSRIENFIGFPAGLSGADLATRGVLQMLKFGARLVAPVSVQKITPAPSADQFHRLHLDCGAVIGCRVLLLALGVRLRQLEAEGADRFTGQGIYYACTTVEADLYDNSDVAVVGAGNSAGQAVMFLAECCRSRTVHLVVRRKLGPSMSEYLTQRIRGTPNVVIHEHTEIEAVHGNRHIERITLRDKAAKAQQEMPCAAVFVFIGAEPAADWLPPEIGRDSNGYLLTGTDVVRSGAWPLTDRDPCPLETTIPGILAAGDIRSGSTKRVGFAVGDGSLAVTCASLVVDHSLSVKGDMEATTATIDSLAQSEIRLTGRGISPGLGMGKAWIVGDLLKSGEPPQAISRDAVEGELARLSQSFDETLAELDRYAKRIEAEFDAALAGIFRVHGDMLRELFVSGEFERELCSSLVTAEAAVRRVLLRWYQKFEAIENQTFRQRADDVLDLGRNIVRRLRGGHPVGLQDIPERSILVVERLLPSDVVLLPKQNVAAVVVETLGQGSHAALLAREKGIPTITEIPGILSQIRNGMELLVDGFRGTLVIAPSAATEDEFQQRLENWRATLVRCKAACRQPAKTRDGQLITVEANIGIQDDVELALDNGADGVGLLRIEQLYFARPSLPTEDELARELASLIAPLGDRSVTVRLLDVGGDKPLSYLRLPPAPNPVLGRRGVRLLLNYPQLVRTQIGAILRLASEHSLRVLIPMVTIEDDIRRMREMFDAIVAERKVASPPPFGAMIETPAAALGVSALLKHVDFFCVGTNDLAQYTLAAARDDASVNDYYLDSHESILRLLGIVAGDAADRPLTLCGELAGREELVPRLLQMGFRSLSVAPTIIPTTKALIRKLDVAERA